MNYIATFILRNQINKFQPENAGDAKVLTHALNNKRQADRGSMNQSAWKQAKQFMLPYDCGASQVHLLSIPKKYVAHALEVIDKNVLEPKVGLISSEPLEKSIILSEVIHNEELVTKFSQGQSTVSTLLFDTADVTFDFWAEENSDTFDLEVWFWADQFFLSEDVDNLKRFNELLLMLKTIARDGSNKCILTPGEASDPLEDLRKGYGIEIELI